MPIARETRSMPDPAFTISTICGSITPYFGVRHSKITNLRRLQRALPSIVQRSVFGNSHLVTAGSWAAGAAAGATDAIRPVSRL